MSHPVEVSEHSKNDSRRQYLLIAIEPLPRPHIEFTISRANTRFPLTLAINRAVKGLADELLDAVIQLQGAPVQYGYSPWEPSIAQYFSFFWEGTDNLGVLQNLVRRVLEEARLASAGEPLQVWIPSSDLPVTVIKMPQRSIDNGNAFESVGAFAIEHALPWRRLTPQDIALQASPHQIALLLALLRRHEIQVEDAIQSGAWSLTEEVETCAADSKWPRTSHCLVSPPGVPGGVAFQLVPKCALTKGELMSALEAILANPLSEQFRFPAIKLVKSHSKGTSLALVGTVSTSSEVRWNQLVSHAFPYDGPPLIVEHHFEEVQRLVVGKPRVENERESPLQHWARRQGRSAHVSVLKTLCPVPAIFGDRVALQRIMRFIILSKCPFSVSPASSSAHEAPQTKGYAIKEFGHCRGRGGAHLVARNGEEARSQIYAGT